MIPLPVFLGSMATSGTAAQQVPPADGVLASHFVLHSAPAAEPRDVGQAGGGTIARARQGRIGRLTARWRDGNDWRVWR